MVITYDTSFKNMDPVTEVVVLKWQDGKWRGAGYNAGPKQAVDDHFDRLPRRSTRRKPRRRRT